MGRTLYTASKKKAAKTVFLNGLAAGKSVHNAADEAGVNFRNFYRWRDEDSEFEDGWKQATSKKLDDLEVEALRRAVKGVEKPVYRGGEIVGHVTDYSDSMLMFLLKAQYPEKYDAKSTSAKAGSSVKDNQTNTQTVEGALDALKRKFAAVTQPRKKKPLFWKVD